MSMHVQPYRIIATAPHPSALLLEIPALPNQYMRRKLVLKLRDTGYMSP